MIVASPAWNPQATFALDSKGSSSASSPSGQRPKPSPTSALRSIAAPPVTSTRIVADRPRLGPRAGTDWPGGRFAAEAGAKARVHEHSGTCGTGVRGPAPAARAAQDHRSVPDRDLARVVRLLPLRDG